MLRQIELVKVPQNGGQVSNFMSLGVLVQSQPLRSLAVTVFSSSTAPFQGLSGVGLVISMASCKWWLLIRDQIVRFRS